MKTLSFRPALFWTFNQFAGFCRGLFLIAALPLLVSHARAQFTWDGGGGGSNLSWSTASNWNPDTAPTTSSNQAIIFTSSSTTLLPFANLTFNTGSNNYTEVWQVGSITFNSGSSSHVVASNTSGSTPGTGGISISSNGGSNVAVSNDSNVQQTITSGLTLTNATNNIFRSTVSSGSLLIASSFLNNNSNLITTNATGGAGVLIQSAISGTGGLTISGAGTTTLQGTNTYSGATTLSSGSILSINSNTALGTGTFVISGGTIDNGSSAAITLKNNNAQTWNGDFTYTGASQSLNLGTGTATLGASRTVTVSGQTLTVGGTITDGASSFSLTKQGAGALTLAGANTFDGGVTLGAGTLNINNAAALGTGTLTISGGTLDNTSGAAITNSNNNAQAWNGNFAFTGTNNLNLGTGTVTLSATRTITTSAGELTAGPITDGAGTFGLVKQGAGTLTLAGAGTYDGGVTLSAGTLNVNNATGLGTGGLTIGATGTTLGTTAGAVAATNTVTLSNALTANIGAANALTLSGLITGAGSLTKTGGGALTLSSTTSTFSGGVTLTGGTLNINGSAALGNGTFTINDGTTINNTSGATVTSTRNNTQSWNGNFTFAGSNALNLGTGLATLSADRTVTVAGSTLTVGALTGTNRSLTVQGAGNLTIGGAITTGTGNITQSGTGNLTLSGGTANTFSGGVVLNSGTLAIGANNTLGTGVLTVNGGTLNTSGANRSLTNAISFGSGANLTFAGANNLTASGTITLSGTNTVSVSANTMTASGVIAGGSANLTKTGNGTLVIAPTGTGVSTYTGTTTVNAGTLSLRFDGLSAGSPVNVVSSSSTLVLGGGTLNVDGKTGGTSTQTFAGTTVNAGASGISRTTSGPATTNVALGAITRNAGGTLNIITAAGTGNVTTTTTSTSGLLGTGQAFATITSNAWATRDAGGNIIAVTGTAGDVTGNFTTSNNINTLTNNLTLDSKSVNSLRWNEVASRTYTISGGTNTLTISSGGILGISTTTAANTFTITSGSVTTDANRELALINFGAGNITIGSNIIGATTGVTKSGTGAAILSGNNTYSGATYVNQGTLTISGNNTLTGNTHLNGGTLILGNNTALGQAGTASQLIINGGTLNVNAARTLTSNNTQQWNGDFTFAGSNTLNMGTGAVTLGGNRTVTVTASTLTVGGAIGGGAVSLTKAGGGTLALSGVNTYSGGTTVSGGTMTINSGGGLASTGALTVTGATVNVNNAAQTISSLSGNGTVNLSGTNTVLTVDTSGANTFTGTIATATGSLVKTGTGTLTLSGTSSFGNTTVGTTIANGTLVVSTIANQGTSSSLGQGNITLGATTNSGTLHYVGTGNTSNRNITLAGTSGGGTIIADGTGNLTLSGTVTSNVAGAKTLTLAGSNLGANTLGGIVSDGTGTVALTKTGTGNWTLTAANTFTGGTTISGGNLTVASGGSLGGSAGNLTLTGGTLNLNNTAQTVGNLSGSAGTINLAGTNTLTVAQAVANTYSGGFSGAGNIVKTGASTLTLAGSGTNTGQVTVAAGTLAVTGATSLGAVGTGNVSVINGATLALGAGYDSNHGRLTLGNATTTGTVIGNAASTARYTGDIVLGNSTTITGVGSNYLALGAQPPALGRTGYDITPQHSTVLDLGANNLNTAGTGTIYINSMITGTGNLTVAMTSSSDTTSMTSRMNTFTGTVNIDKGTLELYSNNSNSSPFNPATPNYHLITGNVTIGNGAGGTSGGNVRDSYVYDALFTQNNSDGSQREQIYLNARVTLNQDGRWNLFNEQTIGSLVFNGGRIELGTSSPYGNLYLNGDVTVNATAGNTAYITGGQPGTGLSLTRAQTGGTGVSNSVRTFTVGDSSAVTDDLRIEARIFNGGIIKEGAGTMTVTNTNTYELTTTVNNGIFNVQNNSGLGAGGSDSDATTVNTGGQLQLDNTANGNLVIASEKLNLLGTGFGWVSYDNTATAGGTLLNNAGSHTWNGAVVSTDGSINTGSAGRTLTIGGTVSTGGSIGTTIFNAGNLTITGDIGGSAGFAKYGSGTTVIAGAGSNSYTGATNVYGGVLHIQKATALGSDTGSTTVSSGASLYVSGGFTQAGLESIFISGTGTGGANQGALHNVSGTNILSGVTTLNAASTITAAAGSSLQIRGGITGSQDLTLGNATSSHTGTIIMAPSSGSITGTVGQVHLAAGTFQVGGAGTTTLNTAELTTASSTTLILASGGTVNSVYDNGTVSNFNGVIGSGSTGTFAVTGTGGIIGGGGTALAFNTSFSAPSATFTFGGTSIGTNANPLRLELGSLSSNIDIEFGTIRITGDTILDFNNSIGTSLTSATLIIDAGVKITVEGWTWTANNTANSTIWYATLTNSGVQGWNAAPGNTVNQNLSLAGGTLYGNAPLNQITFTNYTGLTTTWVSGTANGWFDKEIRPTPEPATYGAIFMTGALGLLGYRRYRSRKSAPAAPQA
jgi:autotransporter-associated beta strand protein